MNKIYNKTRSFSRKIYLGLLGSIARPSKGIHLLNSHLLTLSDDLDSSFFDNQLMVLSRKSTIIPFGEAVELIKNKRGVNHSLIAFSYDDGFAECHSHIAPILEKYNGYGCFFINPSFINGDKEYVDNFLINTVHLPTHKIPMSWEQIKELAANGHIIGAHTMEHKRISVLKNNEEIHYQIGFCKNEISKNTEIDTEYFAFPYGLIEKDFDMSAVLIAEMYYKYIFSASNWQRYYSYNKKVLNRRHCEPYWKASHINYFLSKTISY